jgi:hypothetical protein
MGELIRVLTSLPSYTNEQSIRTSTDYTRSGACKFKSATSLNRPVRHLHFQGLRSVQQSSLQVAPYPIRDLLQLLKTEEDQDCGRLQPEPCRDPALEHEGVSFVCYGCPDSPDRGRRPRT